MVSISLVNAERKHLCIENVTLKNPNFYLLLKNWKI